MTSHWDVIIVGSGFGGALAAWPLVQSGRRVLMLERGGWVSRGPENWAPNGSGLTSQYFSRESPFDVVTRGRRYEDGGWHCVGGQSVFYGGASFRFRESDFQHKPSIVGESAAAWPYGYDDLEPYYAHAEMLLGVSGDSDPGGPWRSAPFPHPAAPLAPSAQRISDAAVRAGLTPTRIPIAISFHGSDERRACLRCGTCDGYACAAGAKNDVATGIIPHLVARGMTLRANTVCVRLVHRGSRVTAVECIDRVTGEPRKLTADTVVLAAGTLATPHLLLASGVESANPAGAMVGRYLTRHRNAVVLGVFSHRPNPSGEFDKQIVLLDHYEEAGSIQQLTPPVGLVRAYLPASLRAIGAGVVRHALGLIVIAEDEPRWENAVSIDRRRVDRFGLPRLVVRHAYTLRDERAARTLVGHARRVLRTAGARFTLVHAIRSFSHALGTVRMGTDPSTSPLDGDGRFRGIENLVVADGSIFPRSAGLNPSLTIAANALRIGSRMVGSPRALFRMPLPQHSPLATRVASDHP